MEMQLDMSFSVVSKLTRTETLAGLAYTADEAIENNDRGLVYSSASQPHVFMHPTVGK